MTWTHHHDRTVGVFDYPGHNDSKIFDYWTNESDVSRVARMSEAIYGACSFDLPTPHLAALMRVTANHVNQSALQNRFCRRRYRRPNRPATGVPGRIFETMNVANRAHAVPIHV
jgi:hypothetical protein